MITLCFDIETVPDTQTGKRVLHLTTNDPEQIASAMAAAHRDAGAKNDFLPLNFHKVVAISMVIRDTGYAAEGSYDGDSKSAQEGFRIGSLGQNHTAESSAPNEDNEKELIAAFFNLIQRRLPKLVSWNGRGFDLPVMHYRSMLHKVAAPAYWDQGDLHPSMRYNNYLNPYHKLHCDLQKVLSAHNFFVGNSLKNTCQLLGIPVKAEMAGEDVWNRYLQGDDASIRSYCETDALSTWLVYLRYQLINGSLNESQYLNELHCIQQVLKGKNQSHFQPYIDFLKPQLES